MNTHIFANNVATRWNRSGALRACSCSLREFSAAPPSNYVLPFFSVLQLLQRAAMQIQSSQILKEN
jgi:hypothetical protein